jgi:hypothetical protein
MSLVAAAVPVAIPVGSVPIGPGIVRRRRSRPSSSARRRPSRRPHYNFAYLDEQTKRMIRRALLKALAIPGYQVPFASARCPCPTAGARAACR